MIARLRSRRAQRVGWCAYDWATSPFSTSVLTVLLGPYVIDLARRAAGSRGRVALLGIHVPPGSFFAYVIAVSLALRFLVMPYAGAAADATNRNKYMLGVCAYVGAAATVLLYWLPDIPLVAGAALIVVANFAFGASVVFYNSLLPRVAGARERESLSCVAWAAGFLAGGIVLAGHLVLVLKAAALGLSSDAAVRICLASSGIWWGLFATAPLLTIPGPPGRAVARSAPRRTLGAMIRDMRLHRAFFRLAVATTLYELGTQGVMLFAVVFGREELKLSLEALAIVILAIQFIGILGPLIFGLAARFIGAQRALVGAGFAWLAVLSYAFAFASSPADFLVMGSGVALAMGGSAALSRGLLAEIVPCGSEAEFFGIRDTMVAGTSWLGPALFGVAVQATASYRLAILSMAAFFLAGLVILSIGAVQQPEDEVVRCPAISQSASAD